MSLEKEIYNERERKLKGIRLPNKQVDSQNINNNNRDADVVAFLTNVCLLGLLLFSGVETVLLSTYEFNRIIPILSVIVIYMSVNKVTSWNPTRLHQFHPNRVNVRMNACLKRNMLNVCIVSIVLFFF